MTPTSSTTPPGAGPRSTRGTPGWTGRYGGTWMRSCCTTPARARPGSRRCSPTFPASRPRRRPGCGSGRSGSTRTARPSTGSGSPPPRRRSWPWTARTATATDMSIKAAREAAERVGGNLRQALRRAWAAIDAGDGPWEPRGMTRYWADAEERFWQMLRPAELRLPGQRVHPHRGRRVRGRDRPARRPRPAGDPRHRESTRRDLRILGPRRSRASGGRTCLTATRS